LAVLSPSTSSTHHCENCLTREIWSKTSVFMRKTAVKSMVSGCFLRPPSSAPDDGTDHPGGTVGKLRMQEEFCVVEGIPSGNLT